MESKNLVRATLPVLAVAEAVGLAGAIAQQKKARTAAAENENAKDDAKIAQDNGAASNAVKMRLKDTAQRLARAAAVFGGVEAVARKSKDPKVLFASAAGLQAAVGAFPWNLALYFALRGAVARFRERGFTAHLNPLAIFVSHILHNGVLISQAEFVDPGYLRLWLKVMRGYNSVEDWYADFHSEAYERNERYEERQVGKDRFEAIPGKIRDAFRAQLPFVTAVYVVPALLYFKSTIESLRSGVGAYLLELTKRILRSSLVLCCLPLTLTEFPCVYDKIMRPKGDSKPVRRNPLAHASCSAVLTTAVFAAEPEARLGLMVAYTWYRGLEAVVRKFHAKILSEDPENGKEKVAFQSDIAAAALVGLAAAFTVGN
mmetsp:Transcript_18410/g.29662  ORF Transcript_18410/g.29662 Transcript_18410/m.29662 type:complete len:373 (+) Transcript_18410:48-1166(+)